MYIIVPAIILVVTAIALVFANLSDKTQITIAGSIIAIALIVVIVTTCYGALAEEQHAVVIAVFYNEDTFIVEYDNGQRDLYEDRGDLVPGDQLIVNGDDIVLTAQSNWVWFDYCVDGDAIASFLYPEDAQEIMEHFETLFGGVNNG